MAKKNYSFQKLEEIYQDYLIPNTTIYDVDKKYGIDFGYYMEKFDWTKKTSLELSDRRRKTKFGSEILKDFSKMDDKLAYILGLIYADGWISTKPSKCFGIRLVQTDSYLVKNTLDYIISNRILKTDKNSKGYVVSSERIYDNLVKLGVKEHKTEAALYLPSLSDDLMWHFLRGFFDGDGSVYFDKQALRVNFCSTQQPFLEEIRVFLEKEGIYSNINCEKRVGKSIKVCGRDSVCKFDMYRLFIRKKEELIKFYNKLYNNSEVFKLTRKEDKFIKWIKNRNGIFTNKRLNQ